MLQFALNPENGIKISGYKSNDQSDAVLAYLAHYLKHLAEMEDVSSVDHSRWYKFTLRKILPDSQP